MNKQIPDGLFDQIRFKRCKVSKDRVISMNGFTYSLASYSHAHDYTAVNAAYCPENPNRIYLFLGGTIHSLDYKQQD